MTHPLEVRRLKMFAVEIAAAVDEPALAAESLSMTIIAMRAATVAVGAQLS